MSLGAGDLIRRGRRAGGEIRERPRLRLGEEGGQLEILRDRMAGGAGPRQLAQPPCAGSEWAFG